MAELVKLENVVAGILSNFEKTRSDDQLLYLIYLSMIHGKVYPDASVRDYENYFHSAMTQRIFRVKHGIAEFESVSRCRRKVQEKYEDLKPSEEAIKARRELSKKFILYARGENV